MERGQNQEAIHKAESTGPNDRMVVENEGKTEGKKVSKDLQFEKPDGQ